VIHLPTPDHAALQAKAQERDAYLAAIKKALDGLTDGDLSGDTHVAAAEFRRRLAELKAAI
jgi:hypothetical protein